MSSTMSPTPMQSAASAMLNAGDYARVCLRGDDGIRTAGAVIADCTRILRVWEGGLVFYGGVAGAALVGAVFARREGWSFARVGDLFAPGLALGHAFGRIGCFAAGCCFGKASAAPAVRRPSSPRRQIRA